MNDNVMMKHSQMSRGGMDHTRISNTFSDKEQDRNEESHNPISATLSVNSGNSLTSVVSSASILKGIVVTNSKRENFALSLCPSLAVIDQMKSSKELASTAYDSRIPNYISGRKGFIEDERSVASELTDVSDGRKQRLLPASNHEMLKEENISVSSAFTDSVQTIHSDTVRPMRDQLYNAWQHNNGFNVGRRARNIRLLREKYHFPNGLAKQMCKSIYEFPLRIWLVDNSGSMSSPDGTKYITGRGRASQTVACTRWEELKDAVKFHAQMAVDLGAPTVFRFLLDPALSCSEIPTNCEQSIGFYVSETDSLKKQCQKQNTWKIEPDNSDNLTHDSLIKEKIAREKLADFERLIDKIIPKYTTPLNKNLIEIYERLLPLKDRLELNNEMVCIVIATDGIPDDMDGFYNIMNNLLTIPCWLVIRICSGDDETNHFWKTLDLDLNIRVDVVDDFLSEAKEVKSCNPWINYAHPLHIAREWGFHRRILDLLDECRFSLDQMREFCAMIFGVLSCDLNPESNWEEFYYDIISLMEREGPQWNPLSNSLKNWIDMRVLGKTYGGKAERNRLKMKRDKKSSRNMAALVPLPEDASFDDKRVDNSADTAKCCTIC